MMRVVWLGLRWDVGKCHRLGIMVRARVLWLRITLSASLGRGWGGVGVRGFDQVQTVQKVLSFSVSCLESIVEILPVDGPEQGE